MARYRIHCLDGDEADETFEAVEDMEALELARLRLVPVDCELSCGPRLVAILQNLPKHSGPSRLAL